MKHNFYMFFSVKRYCALFLCCFSLLSVCAQETPYPRTAISVEVKKREMPYIGTIRDENRDTIFLAVFPSDTLVAIARNQIRQIDIPLLSEPYFSLRKYKLRSQFTNYYVQNAYLESTPGEWRYTTLYGLAHGAEWGLSNNFSMAVGLVPIFIFDASSLTPIWLSPKFSVPVSDRMRWGLTGLAAAGFPISTDLQNDLERFGALHSGITVGDRRQHATFGAGMFFTEYSGRLPFISASAQIRLAKNLSILHESYYYREKEGFSTTDHYWHSTTGLRLATKRLAFNVGMYLLVNKYDDYTDWYPAPLFLFSVGFRK